MRTSHASVPPFLPAALSCDACRYLISNCKDQSIKLWDLRHCLVSDRQAREFAERPDIPAFRWDYRSVTIRGGGLWASAYGGGMNFGLQVSGTLCMHLISRFMMMPCGGEARLWGGMGQMSATVPDVCSAS